MKSILRYINEKIYKMHYLKATKKGEFNYWLGIAVAAAIMLVIGFPILKTMATNTFTSIKTWFSTAMNGIFS